MANTHADEAKAMKLLAEEINKQLVAKGKTAWKIKFTVWADADRVTNPDGSLSYWGNNITDVVTYIHAKDGSILGVFCIGGDNCEDPCVLMPLDQLNVVMCDADGKNGRMKEPDGTKMTASHVLKNAGKYFGHVGLDADANLLGQFTRCTFRVQAHIVSIEEDEQLEAFVAAQNYQSSSDAARNAQICFNSQGASFTTDKAPPGQPVKLLSQAISPDDGQLHDFYFGLNKSKQLVKQIGEETSEQATLAASNGWSTEAPIGPNGIKRKTAAGVIHLQIPVDKPRSAARIPAPALITAAASATMYRSLCAEPPEEEEEDEEPVYRGAGPPSISDDDDDDHNASFTRSLSSLSPARKAPKRAEPPPPENTVNSLRVFRGQDAGVTQKLETPVLKPADNGAGGLPTATMAIWLGKKKGEPLGTKDVEDVIDILEEIMEAAGKTVPRQDVTMVEAGATSQELTVAGAIGIAQTLKAGVKAPIGSVPVF